MFSIDLHYTPNKVKHVIASHHGLAHHCFDKMVCRSSIIPEIIGKWGLTVTYLRDTSTVTSHFTNHDKHCLTFLGCPKRKCVTNIEMTVMVNGNSILIYAFILVCSRLLSQDRHRIPIELSCLPPLLLKSSLGFHNYD